MRNEFRWTLLLHSDERCLIIEISPSHRIAYHSLDDDALHAAGPGSANGLGEGGNLGSRSNTDSRDSGEACNRCNSHPPGSRDDTGILHLHVEGHLNNL